MQGSILVCYRPLALIHNFQSSRRWTRTLVFTSREPPQRLADRASSRFFLADAPYLNFSSFHHSIPERIYARRGIKCPVPLTVRGTQALVSFAPLAFKLFYAARQNAVLRRSSFPSLCPVPLTVRGIGPHRLD